MKLFTVTNTTMADRLEDIVKHRALKLKKLKDLGIDPYPSVTSRTHSNKEALEHFDELLKTTVTLAGRIRSWRVMGKLIFAHIDDGSAKFQVLFKENVLGNEAFTMLTDCFDIGDFIEASGNFFVTKTAEKTLEATTVHMLAKALLPLPSEHFGLHDEDIRLRKRYLDILLNNESKEIFVKKNLFWSAMRDFLMQNGFLEIQMPVLETVPGGAEAEPFITHHNALDRDFYLRISLELPLKKMLVAGYEKVFEIGRIFRNEGIDTEHLQDYTQMEFYWSYASFDDLMTMVQKMYQTIIMQTFGTLVITSNGVTCDWGGVWEKISYTKLFLEKTGLDLQAASDEDLKKYVNSEKIKLEPSARRGRMIDAIFKTIRKALPSDKPIFLIDQPIELEPLAKRDPKNPAIVQRMQIIAYGTELGKGFGELNDPQDQRLRFEEQMKLREAGDREAQMIDEDFVEAMEYGMPPAAGFGLSERLFAVLADKSIRETVVFPPMHEKSSQAGKSKETKIAVAMVNKGLKLKPWQELNTIAHLNAEFGIHQGKKLLLQEEVLSKDGIAVKLNPQHAIIIKTAGSSEELQRLSETAKKRGLEVSEFIREMIDTTDDKKVIEAVKNKNFSELEFLGLLVFGKKSEIDELTKEFPLYE